MPPHKCACVDTQGVWSRCSHTRSPARLPTQTHAHTTRGHTPHPGLRPLAAHTHALTRTVLQSRPFARSVCHICACVQASHCDIFRFALVALCLSHSPFLPVKLLRCDQDHWKSSCSAHNGQSAARRPSPRPSRRPSPRDLTWVGAFQSVTLFHRVSNWSLSAP